MEHNPKATSFKSLAILGLFLLCTFGVGTIASQFEPDAWFAQLEKPSWNPPGWTFGVVWPTLYFLMAVAAWLVWRKLGWRSGKGPLVLFFAQLLVNGLWTIFFFGIHQIGLALFDILLLLVLIIITTIEFWRVRPLAGWLFVPYVLWVGFASTVNWGIWRMN